MHSILALIASLGVCVVAGVVTWNPGVSKVALNVSLVVAVGILLAIKRSSDSDWN